MEWREEAIVLGIRRHGETSVVAELMTRDRGRHIGLVRGGRSRQLRAVLQPGNSVEATWRARLDEHMGTFVIEPVALRAAQLMENPLALHGVQLLAGHLRLLAEREPHPRLYEALALILDHMGEPDGAAPLVLRFELMLLEELGFGLDLTCCALSGATSDLAYVSPRTGRAVTREAGEPWKDRLLPLPAMLAEGRALAGGVLPEDFALTGFFFERNIWAPRGLTQPADRAAFVTALARRLGAPAG